MHIQKNYRTIYMDPQELEDIRIALGLSVAALGRVLGLHVVSLHNMRSGRQRIREFNANSLRWLFALWQIDPNHPSLPIELKAANDNFDQSELQSEA